MTWDTFIYFAIAALIFWGIGAALALKSDKRTAPTMLTVVGLIVFMFFIIGLWISLERPPLRTMGETRLWYSLFLPLVGLIVYLRWHYKWILSFSTILSCVFIIINIANPDIHNKALMPALQSPWFTPHVIVYMFSYAVFGAVTLIAIYYLAKEDKISDHQKIMDMSDNLVYVGIAFLTIGMLMGAIWAKIAWGHYWSWDPKETWAAITWLSYLIYIHYRLNKRSSNENAMIMLIVAFIFLQICWYGLNYLPSAQQSIHTYTN
ncbi:MAG: cytochrome c biogenesis protein CcsA [Dysgonamonadaceae bacterium]|jgi:ABC-type transport system involved in cytochrome c biogenesis permease subunit|nr:cytochrome c biogenesis protein CcsA [Dysgonamonadaceae bacterium]MDD3308828.1 cytochrome c biogenesis protein CcsA [Dysgonamonadaceae bacterium]MDD3901189.1 cytochrome c biogenesis protein CcsA [Dysgonamonadaceae bacterium]MDD4398971.1 cytochrome c biogenesis protein CcsA [Dysgonamonadaceae bacterium]MEA5080494.1 cytochrome c biogenesis protein CcsA [Dysgonamonadaceae bacterium]